MTTLGWITGRNFLVTGGAGFIGSHIVENLVNIGASKVYVIDDLSSGFESNLKGLNVEFIHGSILDFELLSKVVKEVDSIFHLAAIPSVVRSLENPKKSFDANVIGTQNVLESARLSKVRRVVFSSSSSLYGGVAGEETRIETMTPLVLSPYAAHKLSGEALCKGYYESFGLQTVCLRYFNIFGTRQDPNSPYSAVIPKFIRQALNNQKIVINGDGKQSRDFTHVDNAVSANLLAASPELENGFGEPYNVGCGENFNLLQLVESIEKNLDGKVELTFGPPRVGDPWFSRASIDKASERIGYKVLKSFDEGLADLCNQMRETEKP